MIFSCFIGGEPIPKGSWISAGKGKMRPDNKKSKPWQDLVSWTAKSNLSGKMVADCAVSIHVHFYLTKKPSIPKSREFPYTKPDLDKLTRGIMDALEGIVYKNDSQVCATDVRKFYANDGAGFPPGVSIRISLL